MDARRRAEGVDSPVAKFFTDEQIAAARSSASTPSRATCCCIVADQPAIVAESLDWIRREMAERLGLIDPARSSRRCGSWTSRCSSWNEEEKRWDAEHHPFCMPHPEDLELLETDPGKVRAQAYDMVLNGSELRQREHQDPPPRHPAEGLRHPRHHPRGGGAQVRLPAERLRVRHARRTAASRRASTAWS